MASKYTSITHKVQKRNLQNPTPPAQRRILGRKLSIPQSILRLTPTRILSLPTRSGGLAARPNATLLRHHCGELSAFFKERAKEGSSSFTAIP
jgi:hypothetical protein